MPTIQTHIELLQESTVLVVDDSYLVLRAIQRIFAREGITTVFTRLGAEVLETAIQHNVDAIVLDINLPDKDGLDVCKEIRNHEQTQDIPIIVLTATSEPEFHIAALEAGADDFVPKPPPQRVLLKRLANIILQHRAMRENARLLRELERYISSAAVSQVHHHRGVERIEATILFSDMRGFTAASFDYDTAAVFHGINKALSFQSEIIRQFGGYVDGFSGDGMLAVFDMPNSAYHACCAAREIILKAKDIKVEIWDPLPIAIGINSGEVMRGDLGSENRRAHTVIGSTVNVSARLCGVADAMQAIVSANVLSQVQEFFSFEIAQTVHLKGLPSELNVYALK